MEIFPFTTDEINKGKIIEVSFVVLMLFIIVWFGINQPALFEQARIYWILGTFSLVVIALDYVFKFRNFELFDSVLNEEGLIKIPKYMLMLLLVFGALFTFLFMSQTGYSITAPTFQIIELGAWGNALLVFASAVMEDIFFFAVLAPTIAVIIYHITKNAYVGIIGFVLGGPLEFLLYHTLRYGFTNVVASVAVFVFGLEMVLWIFIFRNLTWVHVRHGFNNTGKTIFAVMTLQTFIWQVFTSLWFWVFILILIIIFIIRRRGKET